MASLGDTTDAFKAEGGYTKVLSEKGDRYELLSAQDSFEAGPVSDEQLERRKYARDVFNLHEIRLDDLFERYDADKSGFLDKSELANLLRDMNDGTLPNDEETEWIISIVGAKTDLISKNALLTAMHAWHGYVNLPQEFVDMFTEFDEDKDGFLDEEELRKLLTKVAGHKVSAHEAKEVLETADLLSDGHLGKYEFLGAIGAWYVSVGREPTTAMALAFAANNRTGSRLHAVLHIFIAITLVPTAYFPFAGAAGAMDANRSGHGCSLNLAALLLADGVLWLLLTIIVLLKVHYVQFLNYCLSPSTTGRLLHRMAWGVIGIEIFTLMVLVAVECYGALWSFSEEGFGSKEEESCNSAVPPWDIPLSMKKLSPRRYPSFIDFCEIWFSFNLAFNFVCLLLYYGFIGYRYYRLVNADRRLVEDDRSAETMRHLRSHKDESKKADANIANILAKGSSALLEQTDAAFSKCSGTDRRSSDIYTQVISE